MHETIGQLNVKIFLDGASKIDLLEMHDKPYIKGLTTNPTLMHKEGVVDYQAFAQDMLALMPHRPISFEVFSDDFDEMEQQALKIASWGEQIYVKIPVMNTRREASYSLISKLSAQNVKLNITAMMTLEQVHEVTSSLSAGVPNYISIFAGRIADTGYDPIPLMQAAIKIAQSNPLTEVIWASPRELLNIFQANAIGCHIITVTTEILKKLPLVGYNLEEYSLETVKMFYNDAQSAGLKL